MAYHDVYQTFALNDTIFVNWFNTVITQYYNGRDDKKQFYVFEKVLVVTCDDKLRIKNEWKSVTLIVFSRQLHNNYVYDLQTSDRYRVNTYGTPVTGIWIWPRKTSVSIRTFTSHNHLWPKWGEFTDQLSNRYYLIVKLLIYHHESEQFNSVLQRHNLGRKMY